ncbi:hypothetical protein PFISCL1PPCAC_20852, partial [Pristionchus fissidentatus]
IGLIPSESLLQDSYLLDNLVPHIHSFLCLRLQLSILKSNFDEVPIQLHDLLLATLLQIYHLFSRGTASQFPFQFLTLLPHMTQSHFRCSVVACVFSIFQQLFLQILSSSFLIFD